MILILTTLPSLSAGRKLADLLLKQKLAACISLTQAVESHYVWKKRREKSKEYFCWIKTRKSSAKAVEKFLVKHHPYEVPEILFLPVVRAHSPYLKWLMAATLKKA